MLVAWALVAYAGPERVERVHARKEAAQIELLQRSTCRAGVQEQAVAQYLDRWSALDTKPVQRVEAWGEAMRSPAPEEPPEDRPLAIPAGAP